MLKLDIKDFVGFCPDIFVDYPFLYNINLIENPSAKNYYGAMWANHPVIGGHTIELSSQILNMHDGHIKETFTHELVHMVTYMYMNFYRGHGKLFRDIFAYYSGIDRAMIRRFHQGIYNEEGRLKTRFKPYEKIYGRAAA